MGKSDPLCHASALDPTALQRKIKAIDDSRLRPWVRNLATPPGESRMNKIIRYVAGSKPVSVFGSICENMTSSTKPEVHNVMHYCQSRTEPQAQVTSAEIYLEMSFFGRPLQLTLRPMQRDRCSVCLVCPVSVTLVYCGQTVGWTKMPLGTKVWPRPRRHCVRWGPSSPKKSGTEAPPHFSAHVYRCQTVAHLSNC